MSSNAPLHDEIARELRVLREKGLIRLRRLDLPSLTEAADLAGLGEAAPTPVEALLRTAVERMGDDDAGQATRYLFGLVQGTLGLPTKDLRERAATVYGRSPETFRKERERLLIERVAEEVLVLCQAVVPLVLESSALAPPGSVHQALLHLQLHRDDPAWSERGYGPFAVAGAETGISVWIGDVGRIRGADILVSSENVYLQPSHTYSPTLSGAIRKAAIQRDGDQHQDVVADGLREWMRAHNRQGGPVVPGTVVATSPGALAAQGVRRLFHAAVTTPRPGTNIYDLSRDSVHRAVTGVFELARRERAQEPGLSSIALPLFGSGRGGLTPAKSFGWLWPSLRDELRQDPTWQVRILVRSPGSAESVLHGLSLDA